MRWYVIRTKPRLEHVAVSSIGQLGMEAFLPVLKRRNGTRLKKRTSSEPLFPGYLFVKCDLSKSYRAVKYSKGVRNIVEFGSGPAEVSEAIINDIKSWSGNRYAELEPGTVREGEVVHVSGGPFAGHKVTVLREMRAQHRVCVLLKMLSGQAKVCIDISELRLPAVNQ